jgi:hypothetical protein
MRNAYSYEGILSAVGRALDQSAVQRVAIKDTGDHLVVEGFDATGHTPVTLTYDVPALFDLLEAEHDVASPLTTSAGAGTLRRFLTQHQKQHELVGAR